MLGRTFGWKLGLVSTLVILGRRNKGKGLGVALNLRSWVGDKEANYVAGVVCEQVWYMAIPVHLHIICNYLCARMA
jgi:hypothetical protein